MTESKPWHEDDFFWETWGPVMFTERRLAATATEVEGVVSLTGIRPGAHVLDLGCGIGRHSLELARRGFKVTGVDRTIHYLKQANESAEKENLKVEFFQDDMRSFYRPGTFDAAINMFTSFSYFEDPEEDRQVVANVYRSLKPAGTFLLDMIGKERLARVFTDRRWHEENGVLVLEERKVSKNWGWMENRWIMIKDNKRTEFRVTHRLYSATELVRLFTDCGFKKVDVYGNFEGSPYNHRAETMVTVGCK